jgi:hypothetical protein
MRCLHCNKRLWLFSSKRLFCSKLHEDAYRDGMAAMNRLMEFTVPLQTPPLPGPALKMPAFPPVAVPPLCGSIMGWGRPKPVGLDPAGALLLEAVLFTGPVQIPSIQRDVFAVIRDSAIEPAQEMADAPNERMAVCRVQSKRSRGIPARPAAFSARTHRRKSR